MTETGLVDDPYPRYETLNDGIISDFYFLIHKINLRIYSSPLNSEILTKFT